MSKRNKIPKALTFQKHLLVAVAGDLGGSPPSPRSLEVMPQAELSRLSVRYAEEPVTLTVVVTTEDLVRLLECSKKRAAGGGGSDALREGDLIQIVSAAGDVHNYVEVWLRDDGTRVAISARDDEGVQRELVVNVSSPNFEALVERCSRYLAELANTTTD